MKKGKAQGRISVITNGLPQHMVGPEPILVTGVVIMTVASQIADFEVSACDTTVVLCLAVYELELKEKRLLNINFVLC